MVATVPERTGARRPPHRLTGVLRPRYVVEVVTQLGLCVAAVVVYFGVRGLTEGRPEAAVRNAGRVLELEQALGLRHENLFQQAVIGSPGLTRVLNWVYIFGHWPVIVGVLSWLVIRHRTVFRRARNAMFASGAAGMVVFATFPVAPPRLSALGLVDTVSEQSQAYRVLQPAAFTNQYAAMPSLHVGWDLIIGLTLWATARRLWLRILGVAMPLAMVMAVVLTANHYLLDVAVGATVAATAWWAVGRTRVAAAPAAVVPLRTRPLLESSDEAA